ncbi:MAG: hypothetical protein COX44_02425 [Candidatus Portnoybacteria bacterium CG23_combo_of_CG06-09_8_20_14_all_37_13]|uniref:Uncharacterized protein n=1 Tax=Candidatus Portnoybacteria bacterium CG23_combo_of_CG06-09_8_20_14_all_37_13 TaxID=1974819 RepID=A0A2G9YCP2_9BACT|nr:MAG: hypothetical protein COX44_02425 [Candidatus Portnoybacteria bacterium CG23_combo_of_CG06-09_8_20_14_all_37_13]
MYEYAIGLIRVLEKKILDQTDIARMASAENAEESFRVLNDTDYADNLLNLKPKEFEKALENDEKDLKKLLQKIIDNKCLLEFLFLKDDYLKLKLYLKSKFNKKLLPQKKPKVLIPKISNPTPRKIDEICDLALYKARWKIAKKMRDNFVKKLLKKDLDLNFNLEQIKEQARDYPCQTPVVLNYYFQKIDAARKVRVIMNAKLNNIKHEISNSWFSKFNIGV